MADRDLLSEYDFCRLFTACESGNMKSIKRLLGSSKRVSPIINQRDPQTGETPLFRAVTRGYHEFTELLLHHKANPDLVVKQRKRIIRRDWHTDWSSLMGHKYHEAWDWSPLMGHTEYEDWSPLMIASSNGDTEMAKILLDHGANVKLRASYGTSALIAAARNGHTETAKLLLEYGANVNTLDNDGTSPLLTAVRKGHSETAKLLLEYGANVNTLDYAPLLLAAARNGHTETAKLLLEYGANVNTLDNDGTSPLLAAARKGHTETAKLLLEYGANVDVLHGTSVFLDIVRNGYTETAKLLLELGAGVNMLDDHGRSVFFDIVRQGYTKTAKLLLELGVDVNVLDHTGTSALFIAIEYHHIEMVKLLLEHGADVIVVKKYDWQRFGLIIACQKNYTEIVKLLLEFRANIDVQDSAGWSALMHASRNGYIEVVKILLSHRPNLDLQAHHDGSSALYLAIICQHTEICKLLLINGASLNLKYSCKTALTPVANQPTIIINFDNDSEGKSALMAACIIKGPLSVEIVKLLLDYDNDVNMQDEYGWSAVTIASYEGNSEKVKLLLKYGADVNMQNNDGWSALMLTSQDGYIETAEVLLKYQADVNQQKNDGWSALMIASYNGKIRMIKLLVKHNADVNLLEDEGWSALMIACKMSCVKAVEMLLDYGADVNILSNNQWSALMIASYLGCQEICELLLKHGAQVDVQNNYGWSALRAASYKGYHEIIELLKEFGGTSGHEIERVGKCFVCMCKYSEASMRCYGHCITIKFFSIENLKAEIIFIVTKSKQHFSWNQHGINLSVPQDALPEEMEQCTIHIEVNTTEKYQLPKNTYFASPVYLIKCTPACQFSKPLTLEIQHCSKQNSFDRLCFVRSTSANLRLDIIDSGDDHIYHTGFPQQCSYGFVELDRFSRSFATAQTQTERGSNCERDYRAKIFYEKENTRRYKIHFVILQDTDAPKKVRRH